MSVSLVEVLLYNAIGYSVSYAEFIKILMKLEKVCSECENKGIAERGM
jgi:hypothetical protein